MKNLFFMTSHLSLSDFFNNLLNQYVNFRTVFSILILGTFTNLFFKKLNRISNKNNFNNKKGKNSELFF